MTAKYTAVPATDEIVSECSSYRHANEQAKRWKEIADEHKDRVFELMEKAGGTQAMTASGVEVARVIESTQERFAKELLEAAHPEIDLSQYTKTIHTRRLDVKNV